MPVKNYSYKNITHHYTYLIIHKSITPTKFYIGKRSCGWNPNDDSEYMSSSTDKEFKRLLKEHPEQFKKIILAEFDTKEEACGHEIILHEAFDVGRNPLFYNKAKAKYHKFDLTGMRFTRTEETKQKIRENRKKQKEPMLGKHRSEELKQLLSDLNKGRKYPNRKRLSDEDKRKLSEAHKGHKQSEESKKKRSESLKLAWKIKKEKAIVVNVEDKVSRLVS